VGADLILLVYEQDIPPLEDRSAAVVAGEGAGLCWRGSLGPLHLDLSEIGGVCGSERRQPPFDPAMMTALLLYAYCHGVYSSRRIAEAAGAGRLHEPSRA
jgi:hypothetical protein